MALFESDNLPGFIVLISSGVQPSGGQGCWGSGFLPSVFQGVQCRSKGDPVLYVSDPQGMDRDMRRRGLDALKDLNELQANELGHPETLTRIQQYELAYRMQASVPEVMDVTKEDKKTIEMYGATGRSLNNCFSPVAWSVEVRATLRLGLICTALAPARIRDGDHKARR
jgi:hypothetical protein